MPWTVRRHHEDRKISAPRDHGRPQALSNRNNHNSGQLRFGTSSWSSKGWVGPFYPDGMDAKDFLGHYAKEFDVVEADVTYYRIPDEKLVRGWDERTPDGFVICAKFPRSIVRVDDLHTGIPQRPGNHLGAPVMPIEPGLCHYHPNSLLIPALHFLVCFKRMIGKQTCVVNARTLAG